MGFCELLCCVVEIHSLFTRRHSTFSLRGGQKPRSCNPAPAAQTNESLQNLLAIPCDTLNVVDYTFFLGHRRLYQQWRLRSKQDRRNAKRTRRHFSPVLQSNCTRRGTRDHRGTRSTCCPCRSRQGAGAHGGPAGRPERCFGARKLEAWPSRVSAFLGYCGMYTTGQHLTTLFLFLLLSSYFIASCAM